MNKGIMRKLYFGFAASGLVYAMGGSSVALAVPAIPSDFDGDGATDLAVIHPSTQGLTWSAHLSSGDMSVPWGLTTDIEVPGDYDGDLKTDYAIYRPSTQPAEWWIKDNSTGKEGVSFFGIGPNLRGGSAEAESAHMEHPGAERLETAARERASRVPIRHGRGVRQRGDAVGNRHQVPTRPR